MTGDSELPATWKVRLYERAPEKRYVVLGAAILAAAGGWFLLHKPIFPIIGFLAIMGSTMEFWAPISYRIDEKGATSRCGFSVTAIEWSDIKRIVVSDEGVKLSPLEQEGRLSPFRGVFLRFDDNKDQVLRLIEQAVGGTCSISGKTS